jgi:hypothetical protein
MIMSLMVHDHAGDQLSMTCGDATLDVARCRR